MIEEHTTVGRLIPKDNPKYDHSLDLNLVTLASRVQISDALVTGIDRKNIEIEEHSPDVITFSGKSIVGMKNIWIRVEFRDTAEGVHVQSRISRAHTAAWLYLFYIPLGPLRVRAIKTYKTLVQIWGSNLQAIGAREAGASANGESAPAHPPAWASTAISSPAVPAASQVGEWHPDPAGRWPLRYWDGVAWTGHVSGPNGTSYDPI